METITKRVQFTRDNIDKCQCVNCPVQSGSACVGDKMRKMRPPEGPGAMGAMPSPQDVPGVYCSTGEAACRDLDHDKNCICPTCMVWREDGLENYKYCRDGDATRIG